MTGENVKVPGNKGHPETLTNRNGRPKGTPNKRTQTLLDEFEKRGWERGPLEMMAMAHEPKVDPALKLQALNYATPYFESKVAPTKFVVNGLGLTKPRNAIEAGEQIARISQMAANGELDLDHSRLLIANLSDYVRVSATADLETLLEQFRAEVAAFKGIPR
ncbi:hypothetical protein [Rhodoblastus sp.]|jgi:hypothetical protein|uniref:hypothetical protein n=1 Tax=Rhodoblastus sp. TaxID=1962975 RepID=UPI0025F9DD2A|nr:hypothetical protein [Rhodoblastus sp.]